MFYKKFKNIRGSISKYSNYKFVFALLLFSITFSLAIYLKEKAFSSEISFSEVFLWQFIIWIPFILFFGILKYVSDKKIVPSTYRLHLLIAIGILVTLIHFSWIYFVSNRISPFLGLPKTKYGVFPFFFIFFITITAILTTLIIIYIEFRYKQQERRIDKDEAVTFYLKKGSRTYQIKTEDIIWIEAEDYYIKIHTTKGNFLERKSLKSIVELLSNKGFIRIHRSTVVNKNSILEIRKISPQKAEVKLTDGAKKVVSRTYLKLLKNQLSSKF